MADHVKLVPRTTESRFYCPRDKVGDVDKDIVVKGAVYCGDGGIFHGSGAIEAIARMRGDSALSPDTQQEGHDAMNQRRHNALPTEPPFVSIVAYPSHKPLSSDNWYNIGANWVLCLSRFVGHSEDDIGELMEGSFTCKIGFLFSSLQKLSVNFKGTNSGSFISELSLNESSHYDV